MFSSQSKRRSGFTLIELLVVIAIIGTLASTVLVAVQDARKAAWDAQVRSDIKSIQTALELYRNANGQYPPHPPNPNCCHLEIPEIAPYLGSTPRPPQPQFKASNVKYSYLRSGTDSYILLVRFSRHIFWGGYVNASTGCYVKKGNATFGWETTGSPTGEPPPPPCPELPSSP